MVLSVEIRKNIGVYTLVVVSYVTVLGITGKHDDIELSIDKIGFGGFGIHFEP